MISLHSLLDTCLVISVMLPNLRSAHALEYEDLMFGGFLGLRDPLFRKNSASDR